MGTSSSDDAGWTAGAHLFSGRPDPIWPIDAAVAERLIGIWRALPRCDDAPGDDTSALGYRGCYLSNGRGERWIARDALARREEADVTKEARTDPDRQFERAILATAPRGAIPPALIGSPMTDPPH